MQATDQPIRRHFEAVLHTPMGIIYRILSSLALVGLPILALTQGTSPENTVEVVVLAFLGAAVLSLLAYVALYVYVKTGPLVAGIQLLSVLSALSNGSGEPIHLDFWCNLAAALQIHNPALEWICAFVTILGWIKIMPSS